MRRLAAVTIALSILGLGSGASASECDAPDPSWLLCEDFEDGGLGWQAWYEQSPWVECDGCPDGANDPDRIRLEQDATIAHDGEFTLHMPGTSADFTGGTLRFATCAGEQEAGCALQGYDRLYFRTWVRLAADHDYVHHFLGIDGSRPDAYWDANGNAGCRPNGERWAGTRVDLSPAHELFFYTYFPEMHCDSGGYCSGEYAENICAGCAGIDMPCEGALECCWGNLFEPEPAVTLSTETWTCIEMTMQLNTPGESDGSMAFWVDEVLAHEVGGMAWRDVPELQLNRAMLEHYIEVGDTDHPNGVWFDDVVVSTAPIGCSGSPSTDTGGDTGPAADDDGPASSGDDGPADDGDGGPSTADDGDGTSPGGDTSHGPASGSSSDGLPLGDGGESGCGCRADVRGGSPLLLALALVRRRRRAASALVAATIASGCAGGASDDASDASPADTGPNDSSTTTSDATANDDDGGEATAADSEASATSSSDDAVDGSSDGGSSTGASGCVPYEPWFHDGFETYRPEQSLSGDPFDAAGRTVATDDVAFHGVQSARMEIRAGDGGGFGQWGGIVALPDVGEGGSVWVRLWVRWPASFEFSAEPWMKFLRLHNRTAEGDNGGYDDLYVDNADGDTSVLRVIKEVHDVWAVYDGPPLPRDTWERYEMQIVVDDVAVDQGGEGRFRVWRDEALIFDRTDVPTITAPGGVIDGLFVFTYWNDEMPPDNTAYIDELTIALADAPPPNTDTAGNPRIGQWLPCE